MRALIEKPAMQGVEEYFVGLTMALHHEEQSTDMVVEDTTIGDTSRSSKHRRQSATHGATLDDEDPFDELSEPNRTFFIHEQVVSAPSQLIDEWCVCACACAYTHACTEYGTVRNTRRHSSTTDNSHSAIFNVSSTQCMTACAHV